MPTATNNESQPQAPPPVPPFSSSSSSRALSRKNRVYVFREFLWETYGDYLQKDDIVLDAAGGKGDLSWLLKNVDGVESVIVDPRWSKSNHILRSVAYLRENPDAQAARSIPGQPSYQPLAALMPKLPSDLKDLQKPWHLRLLVDHHLVTAMRDYLETGDMKSWNIFWEDATRRAIQANTLGYEEAAEVASLSTTTEESGPISNRTNNQIVDAEQALTILQKTRLLVGFHADQATEPLMDLAVLLQIPFATVPCCVFPADFPNRWNPNGTRVRSYHELMDYFRRKFSHVDLQEDSLGFFFTETAKNKVLYTRPLPRT